MLCGNRLPTTPNIFSIKIKLLQKEDTDNTVNKDEINVYSEKDPSNLPWKELGIDLVFECTGLFTNYDDSYKHIKAGARKVLISAPAKGDIKTIVYNVNHDTLTKDDIIVSAASCTTNCLAPVVKVLNDEFGILRGEMTTVHAYTNDQANLDVAHKKGILSRRGRASAANIVPASTGAASAIGKVIPELEGKLDGFAMRVPVTTGSVIDLTLELNKVVDKDMVNDTFNKNKNETLNITYDPIVSSDIIGNTCGSTVDGLLTSVLEVDGKQFVKVVFYFCFQPSY